MASKIELCDEIRALKAERDRLREDNERLRAELIDMGNVAQDWKGQHFAGQAALRTAREALDIARAALRDLDATPNPVTPSDDSASVGVREPKPDKAAHNDLDAVPEYPAGDEVLENKTKPDPNCPVCGRSEITGHEECWKKLCPSRDASCPGCAAGRQMLADLCDTASSHVHDECACSGMPDYECSYCELRAAVQAGYDALAQMKGGSDD